MLQLRNADSTQFLQNTYTLQIIHKSKRGLPIGKPLYSLNSSELETD